MCLRNGHGPGEAFTAERARAGAGHDADIAVPQVDQMLDRVTAFMSLLEGHAEHVMDGVGPSVVPSVRHIRKRFDQRRKERGGVLDTVLRKLLGLDLKALQYAEGKAFVDTGVNLITDQPATGVESKDSAWGLENCWG